MPRLAKDSELPVAITQLRLCSALRHCGRTGVDVALDKSDDENLYVYDDESLGYSDWTNVALAAFLSKAFLARNPNKNTLVLLPLDGCIITGTHVIRGGVCDCALLTDKELSFVEFKTEVLSTNDLTILQRATEAKNQLWHTYDGIINSGCKQVGIDISDKVNVDFYIVFDTTLSVTGARADFQNLQDEFLQDKKSPLYFQNSKQFK